jgi:hypothetical protein
MKRAVLYSLVSLVLITILFFRLGFFYVEISPHNSYHLNEMEKGLIENAILEFREKVENGEFDEIGKELTRGRRDVIAENSILKDIQNNYSEYGKPISWEIFRVVQPQLDKNKGETVYIIDCLTKFEREERHESFGWQVKENSEINLIFTDVESLQSTQWRIEERDKKKVIIKKYPNEFIIPYADRYIEFRY